MEENKLEIESFWREFLQFKGLDKNTRYSSVYHFCLDEKLANDLLNLVIIRQKKATSSALVSFELLKIPLPQKGDFNILTNWQGQPRCVIQNTLVTKIRFIDMTFDICKREGEDRELKTWQEGHKRFFEQEGKELGYEFSPDMLIIFEDFEVVYQK